jgi:sigma-E factor negative regulatory protein RseC
MNELINEIPMLEETGKVIALQGRYAIIETQQRTACGQCNVGNRCGTSILAGLFGNRRHKVRLINHLGLSEGDFAVIGINESLLLSTAVLAYMLPLMLMIVPAVILSLYGFNDGISFIISLFGLFFGMQVSNKIMANKDFQSREIILLRKG